MHASIGDKITAFYERLTPDGSDYPSRSSEEPVRFTIGMHQVIAGFEEAVIGMKEGDEKTVTIPREKAYGERSDKNLVVLKKEKFPSGISLEVGKYLCVRTADGRRAVLAVSDVRESDVMLSANHPLAGRDLTFRIRLARIERPERRMQGGMERRPG